MDKKGSAMVEAAVVLPIVLLTLTTVIGIMVYLFEAAAAQGELHLAIRTEAGLYTHTYYGRSGSEDVMTHRTFEGASHIMKGSTQLIFDGGGLLSTRSSKQLEGYQNLTDERQFARYVDFFSAGDE